MKKVINKGVLFETELFGCASLYWKNVISDLTFPEAIEFARSCQKILFDWDPSNPKTQLAKELFDEVQALLPKIEGKKLRLNVAIGTVLDRQYKSDAFFEIAGSCQIATLDAKTGKKPRTSAHIMLRRKDILSKWAMEHKASEIVARLNVADDRLHKVEPSNKIRRLIRNPITLKKLKRVKEKALIRYKQALECPPSVSTKAKSQRTTTPSVRVRLEIIERPKPPRDPKKDQERIQNLKRVLDL